MNGLFEILSNKEWMIQQEFLHGILPTLQYNITNHSTVGIEREKKSPMAIGQQGQDFLREYQVTEDGEVKPVFDAWGEGDVLGKMKEPFVNVMPVDGPITRNGGACSYGSRDIRDWMMKAADNKYCQGHILHINTPGGSAWAKNDFQQGIEYAHDRGQRVIAFIDGLCASAGMYLASLCDEVYVMNPKDELGCVGVMAAFCTMKSGEKFMSGETYREYYATKSINKNKEMRDIAEDNDATLLIEELDRLEAEFRADMKAAFPKATDEHLDGKIFDAEDVMGILCDGQMMLSEVIQRVFDLANGSAKPIERTSGRKIAKAVKPAAARKTVAAVKNMLNPNNNSINMKEKYPSLFAALQVEEMQMQEGGAFINEELLANLNAAIETAQKEKADALALVESLKGEHATAIENLNAEHQQAIDQLNEQLTAKGEELATSQQAVADLNEQVTNLNSQVETLNTTVEEQKGQIEQLNTELTGAKESLTTAEGQLAEKDQTITDLNAQIEELQHDPGAEPAAGSPAHNGQGAEEPQMAVDQFVYDSSKSYEENMRLKKEWQESHK